MQVVQAFARGRLLGEGDILRSLAANTYSLQYKQDPRLELDFRVAALATDLRSGIRLCRLVEILSGACLSCLPSAKQLQAAPAG